ncbi:MAG: SRPBCC family protein [Meiothermus sp.]|nr:SRPBCC family protein [Meiothermus sp.]
MYKAEASISLPASQQRVWDFISNYQNFDQFMSHVEKVQMLDTRTSSWAMRGPLGIPVSWRAITTSFEVPRHLSWQSTDGSLQTTGFIRVEPEGPGSRVTVHVEYVPPLGAIGEAVASVFKDPQRMLENDLEKLGWIVSGWPVEAMDTRPGGSSRTESSTSMGHSGGSSGTSSGYGSGSGKGSVSDPGTSDSADRTNPVSGPDERRRGGDR